ncbi:MAG: hypothetical protein JSU77_01230 [Fidelibacterota bacterium]|nr:MAG: hypothetical protein JSU77_01230 [Candidatus Neomarinimicrobiota bacterium]
MKITFLSPFLLSLLLISCYNRATFEVHNLNGNKIGVLGHRGISEGHKYPGNSFEAIESVLKIGADGSEIDVQLTKDSVLAIFHDMELSNTTNCQGMIRDYNWAEIDSCTNNSPMSEQIFIISVDSLFSRIPDIQNYYFSFDCKFYPGDETITAYYRQYVFAIKQVIDKYNMHNKVLIEADRIQFHQMLKQNEVQALQFITGAGITNGIPIAEELGLYGIGIGSSVTRRDIELAHGKGFRVMTWTPKTKWANVKAVKKSPDFIQTDKPIHMLKMFGKYSP